MSGKPLLVCAAIALTAGCGTSPTTSPSTVTVTASPEAAPSVTALPTSSSAPAASITSPAAASGPSTPGPLGPCTDDDLAVTNGEVESADTMRRVVVSFQNTSSQPCTLVGYPGADLVTAAGGLMVHVVRQPALAAHRLTLGPRDMATAEVQADAIDTATGNSCPREGTLVITPPNGFTSHTLNVSVPICSVTISSVD